MTAQLSRETVENLLQHNDESDSPANAEAWEVNALCRLALGGMDSEPVAVRSRWKDEGNGAGSWLYFSMNRYDALVSDPTRDCELLYTAPPVPVAVPDEMDTKQAYQYMRSHSVVGCYRDGWNDCRAAMLKAGHVTAKCPKCGDTGLADSGGVQPWGEPISIPCDCTITLAPEQE